MLSAEFLRVPDVGCNNVQEMLIESDYQGNDRAEEQPCTEITAISPITMRLCINWCIVLLSLLVVAIISWLENKVMSLVWARL